MPHRVVVIDNTPEIVDLYEELLTDEGYTVVATFAEPPSDPEVIGQHDPDIVIMDWLFGRERTGMHILEMLKASSPTAEIPVIVSSAARRELGDVEEFLAQRGVRVVHKPFAIDDLLFVIEQSLTAKQVRV